MGHDFRSYNNTRASRCCKCNQPSDTDEPCVDEKTFTPWWADQRRGGESLLETAMTLRLTKARRREGGS